jgi:hypothetical protein
MPPEQFRAIGMTGWAVVPKRSWRARAIRAQRAVVEVGQTAQPDPRPHAYRAMPSE